MSSRIDVDEIRSKTTNGNLVLSPNGTGYLAPKRVPAFHAYNAGSQTLSDAAWGKVTLNATVFDTTSDWDTSNSYFVVPVAGIYSFTTCINWTTNSASGGYMYSKITRYRSGSGTDFHTTGYKLDATSMLADTQINGTVLIDCEANDQVEMRAYLDVSSGSPVLRAGRYYMCGHLVGAT